MYVGGGRYGAMTHERITLRDTLLGILAYPAIMIACKLLVLLWFVVSVIIIDRIAGPLILAGGLFFLLDKLRRSILPTREELGRIWVAFGVGILLVAVEYLFQAWPRAIMWLWFWDQGFLVSWFGEPFVRASGFLVVLRWTIGVILPWMLWWPYKWTMWVSMAELLMPKYRETVFRPAAVESFPGPPGIGNLRSPQSLPDDDDPDAHLPEQGGIAYTQIIGE